MKHLSLLFPQTRNIVFVLTIALSGNYTACIPHNFTIQTSSKKGFFARTAAYVKGLFSSKRMLPVNSQSLSVRNDLLDLIDMCDLDDDLSPYFKCFRVFVNGEYVPPETEGNELTNVPHVPGTPCKISIIVPAATLLAILENQLFSPYKEHISDHLHSYIISRPFVNWISKRFGSQKQFIDFLTKYAKAQVVFSYQLDSRDLNRSGQLSILTVIASKKWEWQASPPTIIPRWRPLRTIELVFHDSHIKHL